MCDVIGAAVNAIPEPNRRGVLKALAVGAGSVAAGAVATGPAVASGPASTGPATSGRGHRTRLVTIGTLGGPTYMVPGSTGICTAVVYGDRHYLVDLGMGSYKTFIDSKLWPQTGANDTLSGLAGILFTHLHSDHTTDWAGIYATGSMNAANRATGAVPGPIKVFGPGNRGSLPAVFPPHRPAPPVVNPADPTPGISAMTGYLRQAFAQDFNDRLRDSSFPDPKDLFDVHDIDLTGIWDPASPAGVPPRISPFPVWQDGDVSITATLVDHHAMSPSFGFRFDTPDGSIVISGDTTVSANLIELAQGADILVHEVIDPVFVERLVANIPDPVTQAAVRNHLLGAHTTIEQVGRDVAEPAGVKTLVLSHLVPADNPTGRWMEAKQGYSGRVVVGRPLMEMGL